MSIKPEIGQLWRSQLNGRIYRAMGAHDFGSAHELWVLQSIDDPRCGLRVKMDWFEHAAERIEPEEPAALPVVATRWPVLTDLLADELDIVERLLAMYREGKHAGDRFLEKGPLYHVAKGQRHTAAWFLSDHESTDDESGEPILAHVAARALFALACEQRGKR